MLLVKTLKNLTNLFPVPRVVNLYDVLFFLAVLIFGLVARNDRSVQHHIGVGHIVQHIVKREVVGFGYSCDDCPNAVVGV